MIANNISLWNGRLSTLQPTNNNNWNTINSILDYFNQIAQSNFNVVKLNLDKVKINNFDYFNRDYYDLFLTNEKQGRNIILSIVNQLNTPLFVGMNHQFIMIDPIIITSLSLNSDDINSYWKAIQTDYNFVVKTLNNNNLKPLKII